MSLLYPDSVPVCCVCAQAGQNDELWKRWHLQDLRVKLKCLYRDMPGHSRAYSWLGHKSNPSYSGGLAAQWVGLCSISRFSDGESLYKPVKKRGIVIREASGRVCSHSSSTLICQSGRVCTISWKWWDVSEMSCGIVKKKQVCVWGSVESWVSGLQESVSLIASQPIGGTEWYQATLSEGGKK